MKIERNILERIMFMLNLGDNKDFNINLDTYLDAASTKEEIDKSRNVLFGIIASKLYSEYFNVIREQSDGEKLLNTLASFGSSSIDDRKFNDILKQVENVLKPLVKIDFNEILDIDIIKDIAQEVESSTACMLLDEYKNDAKINKLISALEEIVYTIRTKAALAREDRKVSEDTQSTIDDCYKLLNEIKVHTNMGAKEDAQRVLKEYAKLSHKAFKSINKKVIKGKGKKSDYQKKDKKVEKTSNKLSVVITDGLSNLLKKNSLAKKFKLNRTPKKGKVIKTCIFGACVIAVLVGSTWYTLSKNNKKEENIKQKPIESPVLQLYNGVVYGVRISDKTLAEIETVEEKKENKQDPSLNKSNVENESSSVEPTKEPIESSTESSSLEETPVPTAKPTPVVTPVPTETPKPIETPAPTETPVPVTDVYAEKVSAATNTIYNNFGMFTGYGYDDIEMAIRALNNLESTMSINTAVSIICDVLNTATIPGVANAVAGEQVYGTNAVNVADMLIFDQEGKNAVESMELNLNGALTDVSNLNIYGERTVVEEAIILNGGVSGGIGINSGDPAARLLWAKLAIYTNAVINTLGSDYTTYVGDQAFTIGDVNDASLYEAMANAAIQELSNQKTM